MTNCKNCNTAFTGNFCPQCGQKADTHRFTTHHLVHELIHAVTHADKSIFGFIKAMLTHPGQTVKNYLEGQRKRYFNPFTAFILMVGFQIIVLGLVKHPVRVGASPEELRGIRIEEFIHHNLKLMFVALLPFLSFLTWLFYRRYNYAEHFVLNVFNAGIISLLFTILYAIAGFIFHVDSAALGYFNFAISFLYPIWVMWVLFADLPWWRIILYEFLISIIYYAFTIALGGLMVAIFVP
ncbi:DUF3667 domain-containing protein [Chitinophaga sp. SYP-B3965]|uniref:DUF3667 domain-containing protein n=1 Tax=Chitinophaga sp. SYP-B3965 TaxID=2663120 RepID=UPI001563BFE1|nr:DUF3667 domain-containing protein [Chitinophaga sp. SYP-B3965]